MAMAGSKKTDPSGDLIDMAQLLRVLDDGPESADEDEGTQRMPQIVRLQEQIEVVERNLAHGTGHWVLQVRCDCGRRWFEVDPVESADCPRCGALVLIRIEPPRPPGPAGGAAGTD